MPLQVQFSVSTNIRADDQGAVVPPWLNNWDDKSSWWSIPGNGGYYFYSIVRSAPTYTGYIQYGYNNVDWASTRFYGESVTINSETENADGSITANVSAHPLFIQSRRTDYAIAGYSVQYRITLNGNVIFTHNGNTLDIFNETNFETYTYNVTVQPQEKNEQTSLRIQITYPNGEVQNSDTYIGLVLVNPNLPQYKPMATRKSNVWQSLNNNTNGKIGIRKSGTWVDKSYENNATSMQQNQGHNRIRRSGQWLQLPRMP